MICLFKKPATSFSRIEKMNNRDRQPRDSVQGVRYWLWIYKGMYENKQIRPKFHFFFLQK